MSNFARITFNLGPEESFSFRTDSFCINANRDNFILIDGYRIGIQIDRNNKGLLFFLMGCYRGVLDGLNDEELGKIEEFWNLLQRMSSYCRYELSEVELNMFTNHYVETTIKIDRIPENEVLRQSEYTQLFHNNHESSIVELSVMGDSVTITDAEEWINQNDVSDDSDDSSDDGLSEDYHDWEYDSWSDNNVEFYEDDDDDKYLIGSEPDSDEIGLSDYCFARR